MNELLALTEEILSHYADFPAPLSPDTLLADELGLTSFELVYIACDLEDALDTDLSDWDLYAFKSVGDIVRDLIGRPRRNEKRILQSAAGDAMIEAEAPQRGGSHENQ